MIFVLEGTSVAIATRAAEIILRELDLPRSAATYLLSHGSLDAAHMQHFARLVDRLDDAEDRAAVVRCARMIYRLYGDMFRALPRASDTRAAA
jgi:hypothetical protein